MSATLRNPAKHHMHDSRITQRIAPRFFAIGVVVLAHVGLATLLVSEPIKVHRLRPAPEPMLAELLGEEIGTAPSPESLLPAPELRVDLAVPDLPMDSMPEPRIEAPRIDPDQEIVSAPFTARANLANGAVATVILLLQIAADGSVISAEVMRSNGDEAANTAAIDYARTTRWIPGAIDGEPQAMQANLTVILGENPTAPSLRADNGAA